MRPHPVVDCHETPPVGGDPGHVEPEVPGGGDATPSPPGRHPTRSTWAPGRPRPLAGVRSPRWPAERSIALVEMQPQFRHTPPGRSFSTNPTERPCWAALIAVTYPPGPPPRTSRSKSGMPVSPSTMVTAGKDTPPAVRPSVLHPDHRDHAELPRADGRRLCATHKRRLAPPSADPSARLLRIAASRRRDVSGSGWLGKLQGAQRERQLDEGPPAVEAPSGEYGDAVQPVQHGVAVTEEPLGGRRG